MRLRITTPTRVVVDRQVEKVVAEAVDGSFCLLPRHIDFVTALLPGLLAYVPEGAVGEGAAGPDGRRKEERGEVFLAVDRGILVKRGHRVEVSTRQAVEGPDLGELRRRVREEFESLGELEVRARSALARLESSFVRRFLELSEPRS